jgi:hypothetical protein
MEFFSTEESRNNTSFPEKLQFVEFVEFYVLFRLNAVWFFPKGKRSVRGVGHPPTSSAAFRDRVDLFFSRCGSSGPARE